VKRPVTPPSEALGHLLHRSFQVADAIFQRCTSGTIEGVTFRQLALLTALSRKDRLSQAALTKATGIDRSTMAQMTRKLMAQGLVKRRRARRDARAYELRLTAEGRAVLRQAQPALAEVDRELLECVPKAHRGIFRRALEAIAANPAGDLGKR
jgi:DNA-binding MarR family transcriptional regulator